MASFLHPAPDWIVCGLGGKDVTRIVGGKPQVTLAKSIDKLRELRRIAAERTPARWVWLTPVPVDEERAGANAAFRYGASSWRNADVAALADEVRAFDDPVVDLVDVFGVPAHPELQGRTACIPPSPASNGSSRHSSRRSRGERGLPSEPSNPTTAPPTGRPSLRGRPVEAAA
ncbi:MAG TPA: hypothetical protein VIU11_15050 [Nakamurella sp.]